MIQHALHDAVCAPAVFGNFFEIVGQQLDGVADLGARVLVEGCDDLQYLGGRGLLFERLARSVMSRAFSIAMTA
jgi:hypothetical protein